MNLCKNKRGISLIVLVITIIIMIILAGAIILSLNSSNIIEKANKASEDYELASVKDLALVAQSDWELNKETLTKEYEDFSEYAKTRMNSAGIKTQGEGSYEVTNEGKIYKYPVIPKGFVASEIEGETKVSEGLVIYELKPNETQIPSDSWYETDTTTVEGQTLLKVHTERNQYVWVPIEGEFERIPWQKEGLTNIYVEPLRKGIRHMDDITIYKDEIAQYNKMKESAEKYGGFYIARYEAGLPEGKTADNVLQDGVDEPVSKKGVKVWRRIAFDSTWNEVGFGVDTNNGVAKVAKDTEIYSDVVRHLIYGIQWDTALKFINDAEHNVNNSSTWGNHKDYNQSVDESKQVQGAGDTYMTTGYSEYWKAKNIYDMAGNIFEWTYEALALSDSWGRVVRGGTYYSSGASKAAIERDNAIPSNINFTFRMVLYFK